MFQNKDCNGNVPVRKRKSRSSHLLRPRRFVKNGFRQALSSPGDGEYGSPALGCSVSLVETRPPLPRAETV